MKKSRLDRWAIVNTGFSGERSFFQVLINSATVLLVAFSSLSAVDENDSLWRAAAQAYQFRHDETGHLHLKGLMEKNPGDTDLAWRCLQLMFNKTGRSNSEDYWTLYAARRLCALERLGVVSINNATIRDAYNLTLQNLVKQGRLLEAVELVDRFVKQNPHDLYWRMSQARLYRQVGSRKTQPLIEKLKGEMDLDHPHSPSRELWHKFAAEVGDQRIELLPVLGPLPEASPLALMQPDDPDGEWALLAARPAGAIPRQIERLAGKLRAPETIVPWRDTSGLTDPARALDLHLLHQYRREQADLGPLRKLQAERFAQEVSESVEVNTLALFRRYPWALPAQNRLLTEANRLLWSGRMQAALRSFQDLLDHAVDQEVRDAAQVGYWIALSRINSGMETPAMLLGKVDASRQLMWMGKPTTAGEICSELLKNQGAPRPVLPLSLGGLSQHIIHLPPVAPWSTNTPATVDLTVAGGNLLVSSRNVLAMYDVEQPTDPIWSRLQQHHAEENRPGDYHPGYFEPQAGGPLLFTRWGFLSVPRGIAAIDSATGRPLWSNELSPYDSNRRRRFNVPVGDPVLSDGLLYYLQWNTRDNINHNRGRRVNLVCFDPQYRSLVWENTLAESGTVGDLTRSVERASPQSAIFGNRVTIAKGSVYSNTNSGFVARSDARDGRADWIHYYRRGSHRAGPINLGSPPLIVGDKVIFMPRDASHVFALDRQSGRLVWENPLVMGVEMLGVTEDLLIVRGLTLLAGLDLTNGVVRWYRPLSEPVVGRMQLSGSSIFLSRFDQLLRLDARTGNLEESRPWELDNERPLNFMITGKKLFVVTDKPAADPEGDTEPVKPPAPVSPGPLTLAWSLPRANATVALPPPGSPLQGTGYVFSAGILESIDVSVQGGVRWRRFINAHNPSMHLVGSTLLLVDRGSGSISGLGNRVLAYNAMEGRVLWEQVVPANVGQTLTCGETQIFHDGRGRIVALSLANGRIAWERSLGPTHMMRLAQKGEQLQIFFASRTRAAHYLTVDTASGQTVQEAIIAVQVGPRPQSHGKPRPDGYYEVTVPTVTARYVRLVALSEVNGGGWTSISEFQVIGEDGKNLPRDNWKVHHVDSFESKSRMNASPAMAIDNDPVTWWHTPWIGGIIPHPHEIQFDLGAVKKLTGIRYLPAVIINNNGMIGDYELYVSNDGKTWNQPIAKGRLVNRVQIDQGYLADNSILFESRDRQTRVNRIFHYAMDNKPARAIQEKARLVFVHDPYFGSIGRKDDQDVLTVYRLDNTSYRFEIGSTRKLDTGGLVLEGDRLILGRQRVLVADLAKKIFIVPPGDDKQNQKQNQNGLLLRSGKDHLLKLIHRGNQGQELFHFNLRTGKQTEFMVESQLEPFQVQRRNPGVPQQFNGIVVLTDKTTVTAWIPAVNPPVP